MDALVEAPKPPESIRSNTSAILQPGIHATSERYSDILKSANEGHLDASIWDSKSRVEIIKKKPKILGIDGLFPVIMHDEKGNPSYSLEDKKRVWAFLPTSPSELNDKGEVLVVAGDIFFQTVGSDLANTLNLKTDSENISTPFTNKERDIGKLINDLDSTKEEIVLRIAEIVALSAGTAWGVGTAVKDIYKETSSNPRDYMKKLVSRRSILRTAAGLGAAGLIYKYLGASKSLRRADSGTDDIFEKIVGMVKLRTSPDAWIRGRTAIIAAKCIEASNSSLGDGSEAVVLLGKAHDVDNKNYESDKNNREQAIGGFYQMHADLLEQVCNQFGLDKNKAFIRLKRYMASSDLLMVSGGAEEKPSNPDEFLEKNVQFVKRVESPEVLRAIEKQTQNKPPLVF